MLDADGNFPAQLSITEILQLDGYSHSCDFTEMGGADLQRKLIKLSAVRRAEQGLRDAHR